MTPESQRNFCFTLPNEFGILSSEEALQILHVTTQSTAMKSTVLATAISCMLITLAPPIQASLLSKWIDDHAIPRGPSANKINGAADSANAAAKSADATAQETTQTLKESRALIQQIQLPLTLAAWFLPIRLFCLTINSLKSLSTRSAPPVTQPILEAATTSESVRSRRRRFRIVLSLVVGTVFGLFAPFILASAMHAPTDAKGAHEIGDVILLVSVIASNLVMWFVLVPRRLQTATA